MIDILKEKAEFSNQLKKFAGTLKEKISQNDEWTIRGFIDIFRNIYMISSDTKVISKILELHIFPQFLEFSEKIGYTLELATYQNWYPDMTFIKKSNPKIMFAVDLKTTYRDEKHPDYCNGFTLGSHGEYFTDRESTKNIEHPYSSYSGHFCLGIIYSRAELGVMEETKTYSFEQIEKIPPVIRNFLFFVSEKWKIASDKGGSGNTANIGSIQYIPDILKENGTFALAGEEIFDDYWTNFGNISIVAKNGKPKKMSSLQEYLAYRHLPADLYNPRRSKKKG